MSMLEVLARLRQQGVELSPRDGRLRVVGPRRALTPEVVRELSEHKGEILALLAADEAEVAWRADAMRPRVPPTGPLPSMYARRLPAPMPDGCCLSCGEPLTPGNKFNCEPCLRAAWLVLRDVRGGDRPGPPEPTEI